MRARPLLVVLAASLLPGCMQAIKEQKVRAAFDELWVDRNLDAIDKYYHPEAADGVRQFMTEAQAVWPDSRVTIDRIVIDGPDVAIEWTVSGSHRDHGTEVTLSGVNVARVKGTKIAAEERYFDNLRVYDQLGYLIAPPERVSTEAPPQLEPEPAAPPAPPAAPPVEEPVEEEPG